jgi:hypothetical protein
LDHAVDLLALKCIFARIMTEMNFRVHRSFISRKQFHFNLKSVAHFLSKEKSLAWIVILASVIRLLFVFVGGKFYYGRSDYFIQGDTYFWFQAFINLVEHGTFTVNTAIETGKFFRPPGYSFLFGIFYLLTFKNYILAWKLLVTLQVAMDVTSVFLIARISKAVMKSGSPEKKNFFSNLAALLYTLYPTAIVFVPLLQAEISSVFFLLVSTWYAFKPPSVRNAFASGAFAGIATLCRLQCAFALPFIMLAFIYRQADKISGKVKQALLFSIGVAITYGLWPARNYFFQNKLVFSQEINIGAHWSDDFLSFLDYTHSISTDHTPFYWSILKNEKVNWPAAAYIDPGDSLLLDSVVTMCRNCSNSFAYWKFGEHLVPKVELPEHSCETRITSIFNSLTEKQKTKNAFHYWIVIPLLNLEKCFFKMSLYGDKPLSVKILSSILFMIRTILVLLGLAGIFMAYKKKMLAKKFLVFAFGYMISWYLYISIVHRNIEMRYLLHTDIILLIPAAFAIMTMFFNKYLQQFE